MPLSFPSSPTVGQVSVQNSRSYTYRGNSVWELTPGSGGEDSLLRSIFVPPAPTGLTAVAGNAQVTLAWAAPTVLSVTPISDYAVQFQPAGGSWSTFSDSVSTATTATVTGLLNGTAYTFRVAGVNGVGQGVYSAATSSVTPSSAFAVVLTSGSSYTVPAGVTSLKGWAVGGGAIAAGGIARYGGSGAIAYKTWSVSGGESIAYSIPPGVASGNYASTASPTTLSFGGATLTAESGRTPYGDGMSVRAAFSGGDGGAQGSLGGSGTGDGRGLNNDASRVPVEVSGLLAAVALAVSVGNVPSGVTTSNFGYGNAVGSSSSAPPAGGGGQAGGGSDMGDAGSVGAVVLLFS